VQQGRDENQERPNQKQGHSQAQAREDEGRPSLCRGPVGILAAEQVTEPGGHCSGGGEKQGDGHDPPSHRAMLWQKLSGAVAANQ
jgi:hypothetical protein